MYDIIPVNQERGIIQRTEPIGITRYYIDSAHLSDVRVIIGSNKDCFTDNVPESGQEDSVLLSIQTSDLSGKWKTDCNSTAPVIITIRGKEGFMEVLFNQIYITLSELEHYDFENGTSYFLKEVPDDKGTYGVKLPWKEYLNTKPIAYLKMIDNYSAYFYWYGFYNSKTQKRKITEATFMQQGNSNELLVKKCEE